MGVKMSKTKRKTEKVILAIDPGNNESGYVVIQSDSYKPVYCGKEENPLIVDVIKKVSEEYENFDVAIEMIASYGMAVGKSVFETCVWIGKFIAVAEKAGACNIARVYRKDEKMNICNSMKAKDSNITRALIDRFAPNEKNNGKGTKDAPGWFYGFKKDIWQAYSVGVTYIDLVKEKKGEMY